MTCKIVVIGAGPGGLAFAQAASKHLSDYQPAEILVLEKNKFYHHVFGSLRGMVDKNFASKLFIPYDDAFRGRANAKVRFGTVESVRYDAKIVHFKSDDDGGRAIPYDYLVLATGSSSAFPIKAGSSSSTTTNDREDVQRALAETAENIERSESVLVIGGGAVGVEMAGELRAYHPGKKVYLIDGRSELLSSQNVAPKLRAAAKRALSNMGVELILGDRVVDVDTAQHHVFGRTTVVTQRGRSIETDARIVCAGAKPNVGLAPPKCLSDDTGRVRVKGTMEVDHPDYENVFCVGDASDHPTPKMGYWAMQQGQHLAKSLAGKIRRGKDLREFKAPTTETLLLSLGPERGVSQLPLFGGIVVGNFFTRNVKSKDLMVGMSWKNLNAKVPK